MADSPTLVHVFIGATLSATSVGITARVLQDLRQIQTREARIVLGAAVIDDVLGLIVLATCIGIISAASGGGPGVSFGMLGGIVGKALAGGRRDGVVLADFAFFQFGHPDLVQALGFQQAHVFPADPVRTDRDPPSRRHGIPGIETEIQQYLVDLVGIMEETSRDCNKCGPELWNYAQEVRRSLLDELAKEEPESQAPLGNGQGDDESILKKLWHSFTDLGHEHKK
mgnify:CR=1 FL=1